MILRPIVAAACAAALLGACQTEYQRTPTRHTSIDPTFGPYGGTDNFQGKTRPRDTSPRDTYDRTRDPTLDRRDAADTRRDRIDTETGPYGGKDPLDPRARDRDTAPGDAAMAPSPEARILSILHLKNQKEVELARLAQQRASSADVRQFAQRLVRDHTDNDARVMAVVRGENLTLLDREETHRLLARERGETYDPAKKKDHAADLRALSGAEFDREFARKMADAHRDLIDMVRKAQGQVRAGPVRDLLDQTLPTLQEHERMARELPVR